MLTSKGQNVGRKLNCGREKARKAVQKTVGLSFMKILAQCSIQFVVD